MEITAFSLPKSAKPINAVCRQNIELLKVERSGASSKYEALKVKGHSVVLIGWIRNNRMEQYESKYLIIATEIVFCGCLFIACLRLF